MIFLMKTATILKRQIMEHTFEDDWASFDDYWKGKRIFWFIRSVQWVPSGELHGGSYRKYWSWDYYANQ